MQRLMSFRGYADRIGLNVSSISRAVAKGHIPTVEVDGERRIDPLAADSARERRARQAEFRGGSAETRAARRARWRARTGCGFDLGQLRLLGALAAHGPRLVADGMRAAGSTNDVEIARAAAVVAEMIEYAAVSVHNHFNKAGCDYRDALPARIAPGLSDEGQGVFAQLTAGNEGTWPEAWIDDLFASFKPAEL